MDENDIFIDIDAKENRMEEKQAIKLWNGLDKKERTLEEKLKIFKVESNYTTKKAIRNNRY
ncbi:hypothetical protein [Anaerosinus sp.]